MASGRRLRSTSRRRLQETGLRLTRLERNQEMSNSMKWPLALVILLAAAFAFAQDNASHTNPAHANSHHAQIVALDECDPVTFNAALGPDFCKNVALGASTTLSDLFAEAAAG